MPATEAILMILPLLAAAHTRDHQPAETNGAQEVCLYHFHPHTVVGVQHRTKVNIGSRVVHQDLDRTVGLFRGAHQRLYLRRPC